MIEHSFETDFQASREIHSEVIQMMRGLIRRYPDLEIDLSDNLSTIQQAIDRIEDFFDLIEKTKPDVILSVITPEFFREFINDHLTLINLVWANSMSAIATTYTVPVSKEIRQGFDDLQTKLRTPVDIGEFWK